MTFVSGIETLISPQLNPSNLSSRYANEVNVKVSFRFQQIDESQLKKMIVDFENKSQLELIMYSNIIVNKYLLKVFLFS